MSLRLWRFPVVCCVGWSLLAGCGRSHKSSDAGTSQAGEESGTGGGAGRSTGGTGAAAGRGGTGSGGTAASGGSGANATGGTDVSGASGEAGTGGNGASGGSAASGGSSGATGGSAGVTAGSGGALPTEPVGFTTLSRANARDKLDLLLMVDNSISMFQKQALLADAMSRFVRRLTQPNCVNAKGEIVGNLSADGTCTNGAPEFAPMRDMHIGIVTSSLGDHGSADICSPQSALPNYGSNYDDHAELLPTMRESAVSNWNGSGFLLWDPRDQSGVSDPHSPLSTMETDLPTFTQGVVNQVTAVGERGCGYEASLEAWYRFLIDPAPVTSMTRDTTTNLSKRGDTNAVVLSQRAAFLRSDSVVAVIMMTDENDCSVLDENGSQGWVVSYKGGNGVSNFHMPHSTSACESDPNDKCCRPCLSGSVAGCSDAASDPACSTPTLDAAHDALNLRCFDQKRRFGIDLLYPTTRYIEGLTSRTISPRNDGAVVQNPLFQGVREPGDVFLMGILGVPWQDLATESSWSPSTPLDYLTAAELAADDRWKVVLGDASTNRIPTDTLMVESIDPRLAPLPQTHPLLPDVKIGAPDATSNTNAINGHEQQPTSSRYDLQFACIFPLPTPVACTTENANGCDCNADEYATNSPLCEGVTQTTDGTQIAAKAYPSIRQLEVLRGIGDQAVVTSICPKNTDAVLDNPERGYDPNLRALVDRLRPAFTPSCLAVPLDVSATSPGGTSCHVAEILSGPTGACDCGGPARSAPASDVLAMAHQHLEAHGLCSGSSCDSYCVCEITGLEGAALDRCQSGDTAETGDDGFCYVDPANGAGAASVVEGCAPGYERRLRIVGSAAPLGDVFAACVP